MTAGQQKLPPVGWQLLDHPSKRHDREVMWSDKWYDWHRCVNDISVWMWGEIMYRNEWGIGHHLTCNVECCHWNNYHHHHHHCRALWTLEDDSALPKDDQQWCRGDVSWEHSPSCCSHSRIGETCPRRWQKRLDRYGMTSIHDEVPYQIQDCFPMRFPWIRWVLGDLVCSIHDVRASSLSIFNDGIY